MNTSGKEANGLLRIMDAFRAPLIRYAARLLNNLEMAQDAVQNTWIKLSNKIPPLTDPNDETRNWLFRVVHNEAVDMIREEERKRQLHKAWAADPAVGREAEHLPDTGLNECERKVLECLTILPPKQKQVLLLRLQQGLPYEEIARIVGESSGYVGNLLHQAVKTLAAEVKRRKGKGNVSL